MRVTKWGEYGLHCCLYLAERHAEGAKTVAATEIATSQQIDIQYAQQILQRLRRNNIIKSERGPSGGYALSKPANEILLYDVVLASEGDTFEVICETKPLNIDRCASDAKCSLRPLWYKLKDHVDSFLKDYSLADLASGCFGEDNRNEPVQINTTAHTGEPNPVLR